MSKQERTISIIMGYLLYSVSLWLIITDTSWRIGVGVVIFTITFTFMSELSKRITK